MRFISDLGEDCDVILEFDDPEEEFSYLFTGTSMSLDFDHNGIHVVDLDLTTGNDTLIASFDKKELNKAVYCLLTTVNQANTTS
jgi:hypothetical protein